MKYHEKQTHETILKTRQILAELPAFCGEFFRGIQNRTMPNTVLAYGIDLRLFFYFLITEIPRFGEYSIHTFAVSDLEDIEVEYIEDFLDFLSYYVIVEEGEEKVFTNGASGKARKLSAIRAMYTYFYKKEAISRNQAMLVDVPKISEKAITRLDHDEVSDLLYVVETGEGLTKGQLKYHEKTKKRDLAMISVLLGTGMRVSECVGIDRNHVDLENRAILVTRKGGDETVLYINDEVKEYLSTYMEERDTIDAKKGHEDALFLSLQQTRLTQRAVQNMVKKYAALVTKVKNITPHKLRSTFGTHLYQASGDIFLVADALGHKDVSTTRRHYAAMDEDRRREAASYVQLRKDE